MSEPATQLIFDVLGNDLFVAVVSGLIGVAVSTYFYWGYESRKEKKEAARALLANRYDLKGEDFSRALNQASVVFHDDEEVLKCLTQLHDEVRDGHAKDGTLISLFRAACAAAHINVTGVTDEFLLHPFNTKQ